MLGNKWITCPIDGFTYEIRELKPWHFLESGGVPISIFAQANKEVGMYAQLQAQLQKQKSEEKTDNIEDMSPDDRRMRHAVLEQAIRNYDPEVVESRGMTHFTILFSTVLVYACKTFQRKYEPDRQLLLQCHYLARNYGGTPVDYAISSLDHFMFNLTALDIGLADEQIKADKARKGKK